ncbi:MAG: hypothetical protein HKN91_10945 [Acidimicrobiia bacterium]|nr:hypothetical protein [Acidimicrobiia bacterium]
MQSSRFSSSWTTQAVLVALVLMVVTGCSSGDESSVTVETGASDGGTQTTAAAGDSGSADFDCEELGAHAAVIRGANGWVPQIVDADALELIGGDLDEVDAAIDGLRPIQDIDGIFGTIQEGLDNMAADIQAIRDGRYGEFVGGYNIAGINAVIGEEVCK